MLERSSASGHDDLNPNRNRNPTPRRHQTLLPLQAPAEEEALTEEHRPAKMQRTAPAAKKQRAAPPQQQYRGPLYHEVGSSAAAPESAPLPRLRHPCTGRPERGGRASPTRRGPAAGVQLLPPRPKPKPKPKPNPDSNPSPKSNPNPNPNRHPDRSRA